MQALTFSVIIPTYRRPEKLAACLRSLEQQHFPHDDFEVIVVDDSGTGEADKPVAKVARRVSRRLVTQARRGAAAARNTGARIARGRFLAFTDDDCQPEPGWLDSLRSVMLAERSEVLVGGRVVNALTDDPFATATQSIVDFLMEYGSPGHGEARLLTSNNLCVPKAAFHRLGGFDEAFQGAGGEDREFCWRWAHEAGRSVYAPQAVVRHAHDLTLIGFIRQHFCYGRGAALFRQRAVEHGYGRLPLESASFYWNLLKSPQRAPGVEVRVQQSVLLLLAQIANAAGYCQGLVRQPQ